MNSFDVLIEIPSGSRNKYEYDFDLKRMRFDRLLYSNMKYPTEYGFIPETFALDGDPLDVLVLATESFCPGILVEVKPIGLLHMIDNGDHDEKIVCVPADDPIMNKLNDIKDVNEHKLKEIEHFFQTYKALENKKVETNGFGDKNAAIQMIKECQERFNNLDVSKKEFFKVR